MQAEPRIENDRLITEADERRPVCLAPSQWRKPDGSIHTVRPDTPTPQWIVCARELRAILTGAKSLNEI
jgi:hypothetical protein